MFAPPLKWGLVMFETMILCNVAAREGQIMGRDFNSKTRRSERRSLENACHSERSEESPALVCTKRGMKSAVECQVTRRKPEPIMEILRCAQNDSCFNYPPAAPSPP